MISQLSAKYQFGEIHTADTTTCKVTNRALLSTESEKVHHLYLSASFCVRQPEGYPRPIFDTPPDPLACAMVRRIFFICNRLPRGHYLVRWVRFRVKGMV